MGGYDMWHDKIKLKNMRFYGYHGLFAEEKKLGQIFIVNATLYTSLRQAGLSDQMEDSVHYGEAFDIVREVVEGEPKHLIEAVGEEVAQSLLQAFSSIVACRIEIEKPSPPIEGHYDGVAIEIFRERVE